MTFEVSEHLLVPKHSKASETEIKELLEKHSLTPNLLPKINVGDQAIQGLNVKEGDIIKIVRNSRTAGKTTYYRRVAHA